MAHLGIFLNFFFNIFKFKYELVFSWNMTKWGLFHHSSLMEDVYGLQCCSAWIPLVKKSSASYMMLSYEFFCLPLCVWDIHVYHQWQRWLGNQDMQSILQANHQGREEKGEPYFALLKNYSLSLICKCYRN